MIMIYYSLRIFMVLCHPLSSREIAWCEWLLVLRHASMHSHFNVKWLMNIIPKGSCRLEVLLSFYC
jgi:hypothetical protein